MIEELARLLEKYKATSVAVYVRRKGDLIEVKVYDYSTRGKPRLLDAVLIKAKSRGFFFERINPAETRPPCLVCLVYRQDYRQGALRQA